MLEELVPTGVMKVHVNTTYVNTKVMTYGIRCMERFTVLSNLTSVLPNTVEIKTFFVSIVHLSTSPASEKKEEEAPSPEAICCSCSSK